MPEYNSAVLIELLDGCLQRNRRSQELLYKQFYGYAMSIMFTLYTQQGRGERDSQRWIFKGFYKAGKF
jgi:hypothetical protein